MKPGILKSPHLLYPCKAWTNAGQDPASSSLDQTEVIREVPDRDPACNRCQIYTRYQLPQSARLLDCLKHFPRSWRWDPAVVCGLNSSQCDSLCLARRRLILLKWKDAVSPSHTLHQKYFIFYETGKKSNSHSEVQLAGWKRNETFSEICGRKRKTARIKSPPLTDIWLTYTHTHKYKYTHTLYGVGILFWMFLSV